MSLPPELYHAARDAEQRILSDAVVAGLPESGARTGHAHEWRIRGRSLRLVQRLLHGPPRRILEVGCGNGWFSAQLARARHHVTGLDTGTSELEQARRVFHDPPVRWLDGDPWSTSLPPGSFDVILFAASIQYFQDLGALLNRCSALLRTGGETMIVDSHFYSTGQTARAAAERSRSYYAAIGIPDMIQHYHHHTLASLMIAADGMEVRYRSPRSRPMALLLGRYPFPIVRIRRVHP